MSHATIGKRSILMDSWGELGRARESWELELDAGDAGDHLQHLRRELKQELALRRELGLGRSRR